MRVWLVGKGCEFALSSPMMWFLAYVYFLFIGLLTAIVSSVMGFLEMYNVFDGYEYK